jgi:hypothetical protein
MGFALDPRRWQLEDAAELLNADIVEMAHSQLFGNRVSDEGAAPSAFRRCPSVSAHVRLCPSRSIGSEILRPPLANFLFQVNENPSELPTADLLSIRGLPKPIGWDAPFILELCAQFPSMSVSLRQ